MECFLLPPLSSVMLLAIPVLQEVTLLPDEGRDMSVKQQIFSLRVACTFLGNKDRVSK